MAEALPLSLIGRSVAIRALDEELQYAARSDAKVLITGESGVGKEIVARLLHSRSGRSRAPFYTMNCAGVPDTLLESELFGHVRGSFTGAYRDRPGLLDAAHGGTMFMDEVGEMSMRMQALLLRFLETGEIQRVGSERRDRHVDVRVIAATNRNLLERIAAAEFREDLYYRLNVIHLTIPPLRERREDIPLLLKHFLQTFAERRGLEPPTLSEEAMATLMAYDWPGNVRELKNAIERLLVRGRQGRIDAGDLPEDLLRRPQTALAKPAAARSDVAAALFERMAAKGESFWTIVYEPFMARDLTRDDLRQMISHGLTRTRGSYRMLVQLFNMPPEDYKRFLSFLRKHQCHMPFQQFRSVPARVAPDTAQFAADPPVELGLPGVPPVLRRFYQA
jgi:DNA-binding NtrC family response regulator